MAHGTLRSTSVNPGTTHLLNEATGSRNAVSSRKPKRSNSSTPLWTTFPRQPNLGRLLCANARAGHTDISRVFLRFMCESKPFKPCLQRTFRLSDILCRRSQGGWNFDDSILSFKNSSLSVIPYKDFLNSRHKVVTLAFRVVSRNN